MDNGKLRMEDWEEKTLQDICERITDGTHQTPTYFDEGYIFLSSKNVTSQKIDWENVKYVDEKQYLEFQKRIDPKIGDILLAKNGTTGVAAMVDRDVPFNIYVSLAWLRSKGEVIPEYLLHFINSPNAKQQFNSRVKGVGVPNLHLREIRQVKIPFPKSLPEQRRIVSKLDALFAEIDASLALIDQNIEQAEALKLSVLDEEFGSFKDKHYIPLKKIVRVINGRAYKRKEMLPDGKYPLLRVGNFFTNREWYYSDMELNQDKYCEAGDLLYAWSASFGPKIWDGVKSIFHYHIWKFEPLDENDVSKEFMYYQLEYDTDKMKAENARGVGMVHLTKGGIEKRKFALPPKHIQNKIVEKIKAFYSVHQKLIADYNQKRDNLEALKSSLLDQAFKGKL